LNPIVARFAGAATLAVVGLAVVVAFGVAEAADALAVFLLVLCAVGLLALVRAVHAAAPAERGSVFERALRPPPAERGRPLELMRIEVDLAFAAESGAQLHTRVVPLLRTIAAARLLVRHGIDPDVQPDAARTLLGDEAWELVRPDRPAPTDVLAPGLPLRRISTAVDALERL
jgi:hypothetical protein